MQVERRMKVEGRTQVDAEGPQIQRVALISSIEPTVLDSTTKTRVSKTLQTYPFNPSLAPRIRNMVGLAWAAAGAGANMFARLLFEAAQAITCGCKLHQGRF